VTICFTSDSSTGVISLPDISLNVHAGEMLIAQASMAVDEQVSGWEVYAQSAAIQAQEMACTQTCNGFMRSPDL